ncbi:MAG TPA: tripartite tricarboxylate transporter substrate-binding protein [Xanthobacteraceae bacterium]|nr:tripartite tricarboxylate transporter substrate-binding protein [Xanthobacteraceae bacterium]
MIAPRDDCVPSAAAIGPEQALVGVGAFRVVALHAIEGAGVTAARRASRMFGGYPMQAVLRLFVLGGVLILLSAGEATAQTVEQFYKGKTVDFEIGYPTGGSNDAYGRLVASHLGKHIPGSPAVVPRNAPGAGSFLAVNRIYNTLPRDGTVIGLGAPTLALDERLGSQGVHFKTAELNWLGRVDSLINIVMMWHTSNVRSIADAQRIAATLSGTGAGSTVSIYPTVLNNVIGTKFKLVMGYRGSNEAMLAMERGEVEGHSTAWSAVKVAKPDWIRDKTVNIIVQFALKRDPELADIPTAVELARNDEERAVLSAIMNASEVGTAFFTSPGVPADRVAVLRRAFDATMQDPEFLAEAATARLGVAPMTGEEVQKLVAEVSNLSPDLLARVRAVYPAAGN